jgi:hypothetical protein
MFNQEPETSNDTSCFQMCFEQWNSIVHIVSIFMMEVYICIPARQGMGFTLPCRSMHMHGTLVMGRKLTDNCCEPSPWCLNL